MKNAILSFMQHPKYPQNIQIISRLGRGSNSHVFKTQSLKSKKLYALKVIDKKNNYNCQLTKKQIQVHKKLQHPNLLRLINDLEDSQNHYIITDYCPDGEATRLLKIQKIEYPQLANIMEQICRGLAYMHEVAGVGHCDLKLGNILLDGSFVKLCDFGFSSPVDRPQPSQEMLGGTLMYMAPEVLKNKKRQFIRESDVWALGIVILTLLLKKQPYEAANAQQLTQKIIQSKPQIPNQIPPLLLDLLNKILEPNHLKRYQVYQIMSHPFITSILPISKKIIILKNNPNLTPKQQKTPLKTRTRNICITQSEQTVKKVTVTQNTKQQQNSTLQKINSIGLKVQFYETRSNGKIIIDQYNNVIIQFKNNRVQIDKYGQKMKIVKINSNHITTFIYSQLLSLTSNNTNRYLYEYALDCVRIIKQKEFKIEKIIGINKYWFTKDLKMFSWALINSKEGQQAQIIQHQLQSNKIIVYNNKKTIFLDFTEIESKQLKIKVHQILRIQSQILREINNNIQ